ncbi:MAG: hypothetical protein J6X81_02475 [Muribaculaceae bacterium]|nr:hypothetical protein [Muribaculaceae bacterium]
MKKYRIFCLVLMMFALTVALARTFHVEKAVNVLVDGAQLRIGTDIDENAKVSIAEDGILMVVDKASGKRWLVKKKYSGKIGKLAQEKKKNIYTTSKALFYSYSNTPAPQKKKKKEAGTERIGGGAGINLGVIGTLKTKELWKSDSVYQFMDEIEGDSISCYLIE